MVQTKKQKKVKNYQKSANNYLKKLYEDWISQGGMEKDVEDCQFPIGKTVYLWRSSDIDMLVHLEHSCSNVCAWTLYPGKWETWQLVLNFMYFVPITHHHNLLCNTVACKYIYIYIYMCEAEKSLSSNKKTKEPSKFYSVQGAENAHIWIYCRRLRVLTALIWINWTQP